MPEQAWREFFDESFLSRLERLRLAAKSALSRPLPGSRRARALGDGLEFADHRDYSPGDDVRFIDWPYYARMERLMVRLFHEHSESDVAILLDCSASMAPGGNAAKFHAARRAAAALAYVAVSGGQRVRLTPFADRLWPPLHTGRDRSSFVRVLEWLAELSAGGATGLLRSAEEFVRQGPPCSTVLLLSDLLGCRAELADALARLRLSGAQLCAVHLFSAEDAAPTLQGPLVLQQSEPAAQAGKSAPRGQRGQRQRGQEPFSGSEGAQAVQDTAASRKRFLTPLPLTPLPRLTITVDRDVLESYRRGWAELAGSLRRTCHSRGALYVPCPTSVPMEEGLLRALHDAGVVQG